MWRVANGHVHGPDGPLHGGGARRRFGCGPPRDGLDGVGLELGVRFRYRVHKNSRRLYFDIKARPVVVRRVDVRALHASQRFHASDDLSKDGVLVVQMRGGAEANVELRLVLVPARVGVGEDPAAVVQQPRVKLVVKLAAPNRSAARPVALWVAALRHKVAHDAVEREAVVVFVCAVREKVLRCPRNYVAVHFHVDVAERRAQLDVAFFAEASKRLPPRRAQLELVCGS
mmetsp:Transcript_22793/g.77087  ORF Transcript_22793/g.77087 Transcript_22793/m.77087 type:complete len:229 (+) Transcript_22793:163-849(+)